MHRFQRTLFALSPRSILRTKWQMAVGHQFEGLEREPSRDSFHPGPVKHPSTLIRQLAPSTDLLAGMTLTDPSGLFVVKFLARLPGAEQLEFGVADWVAQEFESDADEGTEQ
jgi:hypothetical protein